MWGCDVQGVEVWGSDICDADWGSDAIWGSDVWRLRWVEALSNDVWGAEDIWGVGEVEVDVTRGA